MTTNDFKIFAEIDVFNKAGTSPNKSRGIQGIISTESLDIQEESIIQEGLNFDYFLNHGWFNNNHKQDITDVVGYPESVRHFNKGETLPNGKIASSKGTWVEGYLLKTKKADDILEIVESLKDTPRKMGFSVEGKILKRQGVGGKVIAEAIVKNVAISHCPTNPESELSLLAKSLSMPEEDQANNLDKALSAGHTRAPEGSFTGEGAGAVIIPESLERKNKEKKMEHAEDNDKKLIKEEFSNLSENLETVEAPTVSSEVEAASSIEGMSKSEEHSDSEGGNVNTEELVKSMDELTETVADPTISRMDELFAKSKSGNISTEEKEELLKAIQSSQGGESEDLVKGAFENDDLQKSMALDVSGFLESYTDATINSLKALGDNMAKSDNSNRAFQVAAAKTITGIGDMIKSMCEEITLLKSEVVAMSKTPAAAPKSLGANTPLIKSESAPRYVEQKATSLSKASTLRALVDLTKSHTDNATIDLLTKATTMYELSGVMEPKVQEMVETFVKQTGRAA